MKKSLYLFLILAISSCSVGVYDRGADESKINSLLDNWHAAASKADFNGYFNLMSEDAIFMGTDATEHWDKDEFQKFAKPFFDKGKAWNFTSLERHIYFDQSRKVVWFDELLNTQMKICRGSGVAINTNGDWKIKQYVLSMTIPNDQSDSIVAIKSPVEDVIINDLKQRGSSK